MAVPVITNLDSSLIVHETKADFVKRDIIECVNIVQYDENLPVLAIKLFMDGETYTLPSEASVSLRWGKPDRTFIIKNVLGRNYDGNIVYVQIDEQMSYYRGMYYPVLDIIYQNGNHACSSPIPVNVDVNPVQNSFVESESEYPDLEEAIRICSNASVTIASFESRVAALESGKQDLLISGTNIKTVNGISLLGSGNISLGSDLPSIPSTDGVYLLKLTVTSGVASYSWVDNVATFSETSGGVNIV